MAISSLFLAVCLHLDGVTAEVKGREADLFSACAERHVAATETSYLTAPFRFRSENRMWQTEFWGKWICRARRPASDDASGREDVGRWEDDCQGQEHGRKTCVHDARQVPDEGRQAREGHDF